MLSLKNITNTIFSICLILFAGISANGQVFSIQVDQTKIYRDDQIQVAYEVKNASQIDQFSPPDLKDWKILAGPMFSEVTNITNGKRESKTSYIYQLIPATIGTLRLPATSIVVNGVQMKCASKNITVVNKNNPSPSSNIASPSSPLFQMPFDNFPSDNFLPTTPVLKKNETPEEKVKKHIFIKINANKTTCYAGEPILVEYKLYTSLSSPSKLIKQPSFSGCTVIEIPFDDIPVQENIHGTSYKVFTIRKVQLIPLSSGQLKLDTAILENSFEYTREGNQGYTETYNSRIHNEPEIITVNPLPEKNKPASFSGVIGNFSLDATAKSTNIAAGDNNVLSITIEGKGNLPAVNIPDIQWPANVEHYEAKSRNNYDKNEFPISGNKTFEIPFVINQTGDYTIPPVTFCYFNPRLHKYETVVSDTIHLHASQFSSAPENNQEIVTEEFRIRKYIWIIPAIAIAAIVIGIFQSKMKQKQSITEEQETEKAEGLPSIPEEDRVIENNNRPTSQYIDFEKTFALLEQIDDISLFFSNAKNMLIQILQEKLQISSADPLLLISLASQKDKDTGELCANIYKQCETALYSPVNHELDKKDILQKLRQLLSTVI